MTRKHDTVPGIRRELALEAIRSRDPGMGALIFA